MRNRKKTTHVKKVQKRPPYALKVKVEGPGVHRKSIPIPELLKICAALQGAVHRQAEAMERPVATTLRRGPITAIAQDECTLELTGIVAGSTGLLFRYAKPQQHLPMAAVTFGSEVLSRVAMTVREFEKNKDLPVDVDPGVLASLQENSEQYLNENQSQRFRSVFPVTMAGKVRSRLCTRRQCGSGSLRE